MANQSDDGRKGSGLVTWIIAVAVMFTAMFVANGYLIWYSSNGRHDLVRSDYYDAGLDEDHVMARNALARKPGVAAELQTTDSGWRVTAGKVAEPAEICRAHFYRPDDERLDRNLDLKASGLTPQGMQSWSGAPLALRPGNWIVHLSWEKDGKPVMETSLNYRSPG